MERIDNKAGFTITEVIIASIIFLMAASGLFAALTSLDNSRNKTTKELKAVYAGKALMDELRGAVNASDWSANSGDLATGSHAKTVQGFQVDYVITDDPPNKRKMVMTVTY
jgi:prepilin-type N-terminal cleavage/methylation domain-containing protein